MLFHLSGKMQVFQEGNAFQSLSLLCPEFSGYLLVRFQWSWLNSTSEIPAVSYIGLRKLNLTSNVMVSWCGRGTCVDWEKVGFGLQLCPLLGWKNGFILLSFKVLIHKVGLIIIPATPEVLEILNGNLGEHSFMRFKVLTKCHLKMNILLQILFSKVQMGSESWLGPEQRSPDSHSVSLPQVAALPLAFWGSSSWQEQVPGVGGGRMTRCWEGAAGRSGIPMRVRRGHWEGRGQDRRSYLLSLLKALTLGLLRSLSLPLSTFQFACLCGWSGSTIK